MKKILTLRTDNESQDETANVYEFKDDDWRLTTPYSKINSHKMKDGRWFEGWTAVFYEVY